MTKPLQRARGFPDYLPHAQAKRQKILATAFRLAARFGFEPVETPLLEPAALFKRVMPEAAAVSKEMYLLKNSSEELALRPEGTASIARMFITEKLKDKLPLRFIYSGPMFRHERPQKGRFRQFSTVAVEILGEAEGPVDAEIVSLGWLFLKELDIQKKVFIEINTIGSLTERSIYTKKLLEYLKPLKKTLSKESQIRLEKNPLRILDSKQEEDQEIIKAAPSIRDSLSKESLKQYQSTKELLQNLSIPFRENSHLVRGLDYYNHFVFEVKSKQLGAQSAVLAGGRYDALIENLGGLPTPAVGWGAGLERLALLCPDSPPNPPDITLIALSDTAQRLAFKKAYDLREAGFYVYFKFTGNLSKQLKRAVKKNSRAVLIFGERELNSHFVTLKILKTGKQDSLQLKNLESQLKNRLLNL